MSRKEFFERWPLLAKLGMHKVESWGIFVCRQSSDLELQSIEETDALDAAVRLVGVEDVPNGRWSAP